MRPRRTSMKRPAPPFPSDPTIRSRLASVPATPHQQSCPMRTTLPWSVTSHAGIACHARPERTQAYTHARHGDATGRHRRSASISTGRRRQDSFAAVLSQVSKARFLARRGRGHRPQEVPSSSLVRASLVMASPCCVASRFFRGVVFLHAVVFHARSTFLHRRVATLHRVVLHGAPGRMTS